MPSLHSALYKYLSVHPRVTPFVGTRIFPHVAPQNTPNPCITVHRLGLGNDYHMLGPTDTHDTLAQIDCWADTVLTGQQLATQVRHAIEGLAGPWDGLEIDGVLIRNEQDLSEPAEDGSERMYYRTVLTVEVSHEYDRVT